MAGKTKRTSGKRRKQAQADGDGDDGSPNNRISEDDLRTAASVQEWPPHYRRTCILRQDRYI